MKLKLRPGALPPGMPLTHPASLIATWFGVGLMPIASGTWGSLAALPFGALFAYLFGNLFVLVFAGLVTLAGVWAGNAISARSDVRDPGFIVIDEVAGMLLALAFAPFTWWGYALAFVLFRIADIVKPFPADWCDREVHGGLGVMLDDLVAGLYAGTATFMIAQYVVTPYLSP
jgi:phosphatidylglycerophosphatase A